MGRKQGPRKGSLQFWPRKRAEKILPRVNWNAVLAKHKSEKANILGFIGYKAGMMSAFVKDNTPDSMMKGKRVIVPVTILECPPMKILSVRFYKNTKVAKEVMNDNLDKELIKVERMRSGKQKTNALEMIEKIGKEGGFEDIKLKVYSDVKKSGIKKTPDITEVAISGNNAGEKLEFVKQNLGKEISVADVFQKGLVDCRGLTKGKGFQGPIKRFGARLRFHKSEKGVRRIGSIGAWHPIGVRFRVPMAGGMGNYTRIVNNNNIVASKKFSEGDIVASKVITNYGKIKTDYIILAGSVQGSQKRQILLTATFRPTKKQAKKNYELIELR